MAVELCSKCGRVLLDGQQAHVLDDSAVCPTCFSLGRMSIASVGPGVAAVNDRYGSLEMVCKGMRVVALLGYILAFSTAAVAVASLVRGGSLETAIGAGSILVAAVLIHFLAEAGLCLRDIGRNSWRQKADS